MITKSIHLKIFIYQLNIYIYISKFDLNYKTKHLQQIMELNEFKTRRDSRQVKEKYFNTIELLFVFFLQINLMTTIYIIYI